MITVISILSIPGCGLGDLEDAARGVGALPQPVLQDRVQVPAAVHLARSFLTWYGYHEIAWFL